MTTQQLLTSFAIGDIALPNRVVMALLSRKVKWKSNTERIDGRILRQRQVVGRERNSGWHEFNPAHHGLHHAVSRTVKGEGDL